MIVDGVMYYSVVPLLGVLCSCDDGPLFAGLKWEYYYLLCGVFAPSAVCFVYLHQSSDLSCVMDLGLDVVCLCM